MWLFLGVLEDVFSGDPHVAVDVKIHAALQTIRFPLLDSLMVAASELGDAAVTVPVILVVLAWLVWQRRLRSAAYWISAVVFAQLFVVTLKFFMRRARPSSMYEGLQGFSFPSNHATLSVVTYGFLAFLVARAWGNVARRRIATVTALSIANALQKTTRITPGPIFAPPAFAARPPRAASETRAETTVAGSSTDSGASAATIAGNAAPTAKLQAEASAACSGRAEVTSEMPSSSRA